MNEAHSFVRPVLHLSGPKLRAALEQVIAAAEPVGGIERFVAAVRLRAEVFQDRLGNGKVATLTRATFDELLPLMPTVRRRIGAIIDTVGWPAMHAAIIALLDQAIVPGTADARIVQFEKSLTALSRSPRHPNPPPQGGREPALAVSACANGATAPSPVAPRALRHDVGEDRGGGDAVTSRKISHRCLRDLAAEMLHAVYPEHYPLMARWVWDATPNTGVLREIWHDPVAGDAVDHVLIDAPDNHETFLVLREELSQFLSDNGIFKDMLWYVDALQAQVYAIYINAQGGAYLKGDFQAIGDPLEHTRRILGLDRIHGKRKGVSGEWAVVSGELSGDG